MGHRKGPNPHDSPKTHRLTRLIHPVQITIVKCLHRCSQAVSNRFTYPKSTTFLMLDKILVADSEQPLVPNKEQLGRQKSKQKQC